MEPLIADLKYRLRNFKNEHDPKYNGNCHFDGIKTGLDSQVKLICDRVVGCPVTILLISGIIPLVPGIALTNGVRDIAGCDYLSGTIRGIEALLIGAAIALGVGFVLGASADLPGVIAQ